MNNMSRLEKIKRVEKHYNEFIAGYLILSIIFILNVIFGFHVATKDISLMVFIMSVSGAIGMGIDRRAWIKKNKLED